MRLLLPLSRTTSWLVFASAYLRTAYIIIRMNYIRNTVDELFRTRSTVDALCEISPIFIRIISQGLAQWIKSMLHNVTRKLHFTNGYNVYDYSGSISGIKPSPLVCTKDREGGRERERWFFFAVAATKREYRIGIYCYLCICKLDDKNLPSEIFLYLLQ